MDRKLWVPDKRIVEASSRRVFLSAALKAILAAGVAPMFIEEAEAQLPVIPVAKRPSSGGSVPTGNAFTLIGAADGTGASVTMSGGNAGDLCIVLGKWEASGSTVTPFVTTGGETIASLTQVTGGGGEPNGIIGWFLATTTGSNQISRTPSVSPAPTFPNLFCTRWRASGTISLDQQAGGASTGTAMATSAITSGATNGLAIALYSAFSTGAVTNAKFGSTAATAMQPVAQTGEHSWSWYLLNTSQLVSATANATLGASAKWTMAMACFKAL